MRLVTIEWIGRLIGEVLIGMTRNYIDVIVHRLFRKLIGTDVLKLMCNAAHTETGLGKCNSLERFLG